jgi:hypothetical protein
MASIEGRLPARQGLPKIKEFETPNDEVKLSYRDVAVVTDIGGGLCVTYCASPMLSMKVCT